MNLCTLATETSGEGEILRLDGHTLSVDGSQVCVLEEGDQVSLSSFLEGHHGRGLEAEVRLQGRGQTRVGSKECLVACLEVLSNFTDEALEGKLADEKLSRLLVTPDFTESDSSRPETMGLLDTTSRALTIG